MRTKSINFKGINRVTGEQNAGEGSCEELINAKFSGNSTKGVRFRKKYLLGNSPLTDLTCKSVFKFRLPNGRVRLIGVYDNAVKDITDSPATVIRTTNVSGDIVVKQINNLLIIISMVDMKTYTYAYNEGAYSLISDGTLPELSFSSNISTSPELQRATIEHIVEKYEEKGITNITNKDLYEDVLAVQNEMMKSTYGNEHTIGYVLVSVNYTLFDGSETKPTSPRLYNLGTEQYLTYNKRVYGIDILSPSGYIQYVAKPQSLSITLNSASIPDYNTYKDLIKSINVYTSMPVAQIDWKKSFETQPWMLEELTYAFVQFHTAISGVDSIVIAYAMEDARKDGTSLSGYPIKRTLSQTNPSDAFKNALLYKQKSIPFSGNTSQMLEPVKCRFDDSLTTEDTMPVDSSGYISRYGNAITYNNRLHLFDLHSVLNLPFYNYPDNPFRYGTQPSGFSSEVSLDTSHGTDTLYMRIWMKDNGRSFYSDRSLTGYTLLTRGVSDKFLILNRFPTLPDGRIFKVDLTAELGGGNYMSASIDFNQSGSYNYAYGGIPPIDEFMSTDASNSIPRMAGMHIGYIQLHAGGAVPETTFANVYYDEPDTMLVSKQSNPAFYDVDNSYRFGGRILSISPNTNGLSDVEVGTYPLYVFTDNGIYAITQGEGKVLYANIFKVSEEVMDGGDTLSTRNGVVFRTKRGIFLLVGRNAVRISAALDGYPDYDIRRCAGFRKAHMNTSVGTRLYDASRLLSCTFEEFMDNVSAMVYDIASDELIVSSVSLGQSYVYQFGAGVWHKTTQTFCSSGSDLVLAYSGNTAHPNYKTLYDACEEDTSVQKRITHIQSRALALDSYTYKRVVRCIARCNANYASVPTGASGGAVPPSYDSSTTYPREHTHSDSLVQMCLYGSNDLGDWHLLGAAQHIGYTDKLEIDHIASSYKYYIVVLGGDISNFSEFSTVDFQIDDRYSEKLR